MNVQEKLTTIADNVPKVYEAGVAEGRVQQANDFMESFQHGGTRKLYSYAFYQWGAENNPSPIYDINMESSDSSGATYAFMNSQIPDIVKWLNGHQILINTYDISGLCYGAKTTTLPPLDFSKVTKSMLAFYNMPKLTELTLLNVRADCTWDRTFSWTYFKKFTMTGTIGKSGFDIRYCPNLDKASIINVVECLSTTTSSLSVTLPITAVKKQFETSEGAKDGNTSAEWQALVATRPNWSINLALEY